MKQPKTKTAGGASFPASTVRNIIDPAKMEIKAIYKERIPDPGECRVLMINFEERRVAMTNGFCRYYPSFDEIVLYFGELERMIHQWDDSPRPEGAEGCHRDALWLEEIRHIIQAQDKEIEKLNLKLEDMADEARVQSERE